jgi:hypothetical protein
LSFVRTLRADAAFLLAPEATRAVFEVCPGPAERARHVAAVVAAVVNLAVAIDVGAVVFDDDEDEDDHGGAGAVVDAIGTGVDSNCR